MMKKNWKKSTKNSRRKKREKQDKLEGISSPECPKCHTRLKLGYNKLYQKQYYYCPKKCDVFLAAHPDGSPVGIPAIRKVRELRNYAHILANRIWQYKVPAERHKMYVWLKKNSLLGHIGSMNEDELINIIDKLQKIIKRFNK